MIIQSLNLVMYLAHCKSLKDKRRIIKSLTQRCRKKFNVSISEIDFLDNHIRGSLGIVIVSNSQSYGDKVLDQCLNFIEKEYELEIVNVIKELR